MVTTIYEENIMIKLRSVNGSYIDRENTFNWVNWAGHRSGKSVFSREEGCK